MGENIEALKLTSINESNIIKYFRKCINFFFLIYFYDRFIGWYDKDGDEAFINKYFEMQTKYKLFFFLRFILDCWIANLFYGPHNIF